MLLASTVGWPDVAIALIAALPALLAAVFSYLNRRALKTPSGTSIGTQVESAHHVALGNNYRLRAITGELSVTPSEKARAEEAQAPALEPDGNDKP